jgi:RNA recognition motif-containing protein
VKSLYVGNLAYDTTEADLRAVFSPFGELVSVRIASDRAGRPKGFAFIEMAEESAAAAAAESLKRTQLRGRTMDIVESEPPGKRRSSNRGRGRPGGRRH